MSTARLAPAWIAVEEEVGLPTLFDVPAKQTEYSTGTAKALSFLQQ
jgi:hypothetical protein